MYFNDVTKIYNVFASNKTCENNLMSHYEVRQQRSLEHNLKQTIYQQTVAALLLNGPHTAY